MTNSNSPKPDPGTDDTIKLGCLCPPLKFQPCLVTIPYKKTMFSATQLVEPACPIHGWTCM
jgi:hypothetical protein